MARTTSTTKENPIDLCDSPEKNMNKNYMSNWLKTQHYSLFNLNDVTANENETLTTKLQPDQSQIDFSKLFFMNNASLQTLFTKDKWMNDNVINSFMTMFNHKRSLKTTF